MPRQNFDRVLGLRECIALVTGSIIGSGIFIKPAVMAASFPTSSGLLLTWILAGLITLCGALTNAEAISMFPETGGQVVIFEKMYGRNFAFLYAWSSFAVFNTAGNASIAFVSAQYLSYFISLPNCGDQIIQATSVHIPGIGIIEPFKDIGLKLLTILLMLATSILSAISTGLSASLQNLFSALKVIAIMIVIAGGLTHHSAISTVVFNGSGLITFSGFIAALTSAFWAFDGWNNISFVAGEIRSPQKNIPKALAIGIGVCVLIYFLFHWSLDRCLGLEVMMHSSSVASDAGKILWGTTGAAILAAIIAFTTTGTLSANVFSTARVTYSLGYENRWFASAAKIHPNWGTPANAIFFNLTWGVILTLSGSFDILTDMLIFVTWFFYGMSALGVMLLRIRMPDIPRVYKTIFYPWPVIVFVVFCFGYLLASLYYDIHDYATGKSQLIRSVFGSMIALSGLVFLATEKWIKNKNAKEQRL